MNTTPNLNPVPPGRAKSASPPRRRGNRARVAAVATTAALAALAGVALDSNKGMPATPPAAVATHGHGPVVTRTSGSAAVAQPVASRHVKQAPAQPIVTRTSGGGGGARFEDD